MGLALTLGGATTYSNSYVGVGVLKWVKKGMLKGTDEWYFLGTLRPVLLVSLPEW
jgi:hypothetical protein